MHNITDTENMMLIWMAWECAAACLQLDARFGKVMVGEVCVGLETATDGSTQLIKCRCTQRLLHGVTYGIMIRHT